jgi:hypothetical protein
VTVRCVGGPCSGRAYLFGARDYAFPFNATKRGFRLEPGQTAVGVMRFGSGYGGFRKYIGRKGRSRMFLATLVGDADANTKTVRKAITLTAPRGLR